MPVACFISSPIRGQWCIPSGAADVWWLTICQPLKLLTFFCFFLESWKVIPSLQDVMQFGPLVSTIGKQMVNDPAFVPPLLMHVGPGALSYQLHLLAKLNIQQLLFLALSASQRMLECASYHLICLHILHPSTCYYNSLALLLSISFSSILAAHNSGWHTSVQYVLQEALETFLDVSVAPLAHRRYIQFVVSLVLNKVIPVALQPR